MKYFFQQELFLGLHEYLGTILDLLADYLLPETSNPLAYSPTFTKLLFVASVCAPCSG